MKFLSMIETANDAQVNEALKNTREACTKVRDLVRELDLPASSFDVVAEIFHAQVSGVVSRDCRIKEIAIANKMNAILARRPPQSGAFDNGYIPMRPARLLGRDPYEQRLIDMTETELEAEYERVVVADSHHAKP